MPSGPVAVRLRLLRLLWCHEFPLERNRLLLSSKNPSLSKWGHFRSLARDCLATLPKGDMKAEIARNNPGLYCLLWTSQLQQVFNLIRWSSSMQPINFTVTALIPCGRGSNHWATQFRYWTDFSHGNEVACLYDQRPVSGALSNP